jgi:hypothetical protein
MEQRDKVIKQDEGPDTKPCAICGEPIQTTAKKCIHCGEFLEKDPHGVGWTGFKGKTLWDVFGLLVVPLALAIVGFLFADFQDRRQSEREEARIAAQSTVEADRVSAQSTVEANRA